MHTNYEEELQYKQPLETPKKQHQHDYAIVVSDTVVMRFCPDCGMAWKIERPNGGHMFFSEWVAIKEPLA